MIKKLQLQPSAQHTVYVGLTSSSICAGMSISEESELADLEASLKTGLLVVQAALVAARKKAPHAV